MAAFQNSFFFVVDFIASSTVDVSLVVISKFNLTTSNPYFFGFVGFWRGRGQIGERVISISAEGEPKVEVFGATS